jgi:hypothetical protein
MFTPSTMLRYFTNENGKHYTAVVLKNQKILSLKVAGEKDNTIYDSLIHWLATLPGTITVSDLDIKERVYAPKKPFKVVKSDTITLKNIAPTYDLLRFLLTYEAFSLKNSLTKNHKVLQTKTFVKDAEGNLHPVKYSRVERNLYSEHHDKFGTSLEAIGFPAGADIYVSVPAAYYGKCYVSPSFVKAEFPFTADTYEDFYNVKIAFVQTPICWIWDNCYDKVYKLLIENGYYIYSKFFQYQLNKDSIFINKKFKSFEGNIITIHHAVHELIINKFNPIGFYKMPSGYLLDLEELKSIV